MKTIETKELHNKVEQLFPELELLIGWGAGCDVLHTTPVFIRDAKEIPNLVWNPLCVQNLAGYLVKGQALALKAAEGGKKIGILAKGCDSRSLVALIQEKLIERDRLVVIGVPCRGVVDWRELKARLGNGTVLTARMDGDGIEVETGQGARRIPLAEVLARKCRRCLYPNPVIHDVLLGARVEPRIGRPDLYRDAAAVEGLPLEQRLAFWQAELDQCMRCYACRNACPLCVCQDRCIAETLDPKWLTQHHNLPEKFMFHLIHAVHLAGRCTECGECERVCPMGIPVALIKEELNKITGELLGFEAGLDLQAPPPLLTFNPSETGI